MRWCRKAQDIRRAILKRAWNKERGFLTGHMEDGELDANLLALPLRQVPAFDHPRMVATVQAIATGLAAGDGPLYRYVPEGSRPTACRT